MVHLMAVSALAALIVGLAQPQLTRSETSIRASGIDIVQEPTRQPYGVDMAVRDPFGNQIRIAQMGAQ